MKKSFVLNATAAQGRPVSASRKGLSRMARRILGAKSIIRSPATPPHPASFLPFRWLVENFFFKKLWNQAHITLAAKIGRTEVRSMARGGQKWTARSMPGAMTKTRWRGMMATK